MPITKTKRGYPMHGMYRPSLLKAIKNCFVRVGYGGYEWVEEETCLFAEDMG